MKKIQGSNTYREQIVSLYRDDLEEMIQVLSASASKVTISHDKYEYDSLEELEAQKGSTLKTITIEAAQPYILLELKRNARLFSATPWRGDPDPETLFLKLKEIIQSKRSLLCRIFNPWVWAGVTWALTLVNIIFVKTFPYAIGILLAITLVLLITLLVRSNIFFTISLSKRHTASTFWSRNKDKIKLVLITAVVSAVVTAIVTLIVGRFFDGP